MSTRTEQIEAAATASTTGDTQGLMDLVNKDPEATRACGHEYPEMHRIRDFETHAGGIRLCRCVPCGERLFLVRVLNPNLEATGVPLRLKGDCLKEWVATERKSPMKGPIDWDTWVNHRES